jgi:hypothetical protein
MQRHRELQPRLIQHDKRARIHHGLHIREHFRDGEINREEPDDERNIPVELDMGPAQRVKHGLTRKLHERDDNAEQQ